MPIELPKTIQSHDEVAENLRPLYVAVDGQPGLHFKDVTGMQNAFVETKGKFQEAQAKIAQLTDAQKQYEGIDIAKVRDLMAKEDEIRRNAANQPAEIQQFKTQLEQTYQGKVTAAQQQANTYKSLIESQVRDDAVRNALKAAGVRDDRLDQAARLMGEKVSVAWDPNTGVARAAILKADGLPVLNPSTGDNMTAVDIAQQFRKDIPEWFKAEAGNGGGSNGNNTQAPTEGDPRKWTMAQQRAFATAHGEAALQNRIMEAAKAGAAAA